LTHPESPLERVILWGLMGSGKTATGRALAENLGWGWVDLDREIEGREGRTIATIFATEGETRFRRIEVEVTRDLIRTPRIVFSSGGGWVTNAEATQLIPSRTLTVWLRVTPETAISRVRGDAAGNIRPLLATGNPVDTLRRLLEQREPLYRDADLIIDTDRREVHEVVEQIEERVRASALFQSSLPKDHGDEG
jgi:shikimate kinase